MTATSADTTHVLRAGQPTPNARGPMPNGVWWVPIKDAVQYLLPVSDRTLRELIGQRVVGHRRFGGKLFMAWPDDFDALLEQSYLEPVTDDAA